MSREHVKHALTDGPATVEALVDRLGTDLASVRSTLWFLVFTERSVRARRDGAYELGDPGPDFPRMKEHV